MSWKDAHNSWNHFLEQIEEKRAEIKCSVSNAWFRGLDDSNWHLQTSLFRHEHRVDADTEKNLKQIVSKISEAEKNLKLSEKNLSKAARQLAEARKQKSVPTQQFEVEQQKRRTQFDRWKMEIVQLKHRKKVMECVHYGEHEAFIEFSFRAGHLQTSSWAILAEMQHYRTPTRLLDWTEVLAIAVYFALKKYIEALTSVRL